MREQISQELEDETKQLREALAQRDAQIASNEAASQILSQFIRNGEAEMVDGQVRLTPSKQRPNYIGNSFEESSLMN